MSWLCMDARPFLRRSNRSGFVRFPFSCDVFIQGVVWVGCAKKSLDADQDRAYLKGWAPLVFEDVQTYPSQPVYVGMVYLGQETHFWRSHGIVFREEELKLERTTYKAHQSASCRAKLCISSCVFSALTFVRGLLGSQDDHIEVPQIFLRRRCTYSGSFE